MCDLSRHVFSIHPEEQDIFEQQHGQKGEDEDFIEMGEVIDNVCNNCGECFGTTENLKEHVPKCINEESNVSKIDCKVVFYCILFAFRCK